MRSDFREFWSATTMAESLGDVRYQLPESLGDVRYQLPESLGDVRYQLHESLGDVRYQLPRESWRRSLQRARPD
ncbi:MAG: hypothetical protein AAF664_05760 [Planctomycetota bacterium]